MAMITVKAISDAFCRGVVSLLFAMAMAATASSPSAANDAPRYHWGGVYVGLSGGLANVNFDQHWVHAHLNHGEPGTTVSP